MDFAEAVRLAEKLLEAGFTVHLSADRQGAGVSVPFLRLEVDRLAELVAIAAEHDLAPIAEGHGVIRLLNASE